MADLTSIRWDQFPARPEPQDQISPNFRFYELYKSDFAERLRIDNRIAGARAVRSAVNLCRAVLQPLRDQFGRFTPNSVYRCQAVERALKKKPASWTSTSQHTVGEACDIEMPGMATLELARWASEHLEFDQIICECYDPAKGPNSGWVHISLRAPGGAPNRRQLKSYIWDKRAGEYAYVDGLKPSLA
jgi:hypothetical protein